MTKIAVSSYDMASLAAARRAGESRKHIWNGIRSRFAIPADVKLGVEPVTYFLYAKGTSPRSYLHMDGVNRYSHHTADTGWGHSPTVAQTIEKPASDRFITGPTVNPQSTGWVRLSFSDLADAIDTSDYPDAMSLPDGFPTTTDSDVVVDVVAGAAYFRR